MRRYWIWLSGFVLLLLEGTIWKWLIPAAWQSNIYVVPHFLLVIAIFIAVYAGRHFALLYGLIFGFLQDLVYYGHALGVYSFSMGLTGYLSGLLFNRMTNTLFSSIAIVALGNVLYDLFVFGLYRYFLRVIDIDVQWFFMHQLLPSLLVNLLFALAVYMPARNMLQSLTVYQEPEDE